MPAKYTSTQGKEYRVPYGQTTVEFTLPLTMQADIAVPRSVEPQNPLALVDLDVTPDVRYAHILYDKWGFQLSNAYPSSIKFAVHFILGYNADKLGKNCIGSWWREKPE
jgi:hypothetical protein